jgi:hypothetical protein
MKQEILIYGVPQNETRDYMESLLACFKCGANDALNIERVKTAASEAGYHSFRLAYYNGEKPNFEKAIQI